MCNEAVRNKPGRLKFVPDWFVKQQKEVKIWHDNDAELIEWYNAYKKRMAQKAKIKEELMHPGIHQDGGIGVCQVMTKNRQKNCGVSQHKYKLEGCTSP